MYLFAAHRNDTPAARYWVVEDSPPGVTAAVAAGMTVCDYAARTPAQRLIDAGAHYTFNDMSRLTELMLSCDSARSYITLPSLDYKR